MKVNQQELASVFGVSTRTVRRWDEAGMPSSGDRRERTYDTAECIRWRMERRMEKVREAAAEFEGEEVPRTAVSKRRREAARAR